MSNVIRFQLVGGITKAELITLIAKVYGYRENIPEAKEQEFVTPDPELAQAKIAYIQAQQWQFLGDFKAQHPQGYHHIKWMEPRLVPNPQNRREFAKGILKQEFANLITAIRQRKIQMDATRDASALPPIEVDGDDD